MDLTSIDFRRALRRPLFVLSVALCSPALAAHRASAAAAPLVREFATWLAARGVPAGVVVAEDDLAGPAGPAPHEGAAPTTSEEVAQTLWDFNASHPTFEASQHRGVVHLRKRDEPEAVSTLLARPLVIDGEDVSAPDAVFKRIMHALTGEEPGGIAGTGIMPGPQCPLDRRIRLETRSVDLRGALDEIVRQAPGLVWVITYTPSSPYESLRVGLLCPDGSTLMMSVFE